MNSYSSQENTVVHCFFFFQMELLIASLYFEMQQKMMDQQMEKWIFDKYCKMLIA